MEKEKYSQIADSKIIKNYIEKCDKNSILHEFISNIYDTIKKRVPQIY